MQQRLIRYQTKPDQAAVNTDPVTAKSDGLLS